MTNIIDENTDFAKRLLFSSRMFQHFWGRIQETFGEKENVPVRGE